MTTTESETARSARERGPLIGLIVGACLLALGPLVGLLLTIKRLVSAFSTVGGAVVAPEDKAKVLAAGIDNSMNATAIGIALSIAGLLVMVVAGLVLFTRRRAAPSPSVAPEP